MGEGEAAEAWASSCGGVELLALVGVARRKAWPAVEKCLLEFLIIMDLSVVTLLPSLSAVGSWEEVLHGLYSAPTLFGVRTTGCKFLLEKASLGFSNCLCIMVSSFPEQLFRVSRKASLVS